MDALGQKQALRTVSIYVEVLALHKVYDTTDLIANRLRIIMHILKKLYATLVLLVGVLLAVTVTPAFLTTVGVFTAVYALYAGRGKTYNYALQVWIGFDKFCNACLKGDNRETISSRLGKSLYHGFAPVFGFRALDRFVAFLLDQVDPDHCRKSIDWTLQ